MRSRRPYRTTMVTFVVVLISASARCGGSGGSDDDAKSGAKTTKQAKPDRTEHCRLWRRLRTSTSYHPDTAAYRKFCSSNDSVAKQLVSVAPDAISDDVNALAAGVTSIVTAVGRATSAKTWSPLETKLYLKQVRLPEIKVSTYADQACSSTS